MGLLKNRFDRFCLKRFLLFLWMFKPGGQIQIVLVFNTRLSQIRITLFLSDEIIFVNLIKVGSPSS